MQTISYFIIPGFPTSQYFNLPKIRCKTRPYPVKWADLTEAEAIAEGAVKHRDDLLPTWYDTSENVDPWTEETVDGVVVRSLDLTLCTYNADDHLESVRADKQAEITNSADAALASAMAEYGTMEIATWDQQYDEAVAYQANPDAEVPLLTAIASPRGMDVAEMATRVVANRAAWVALSGNIVGQRLALQDALEAAVTIYDEAEDDDAKASAIEAVEAIEVVYSRG